MPSSTDVKALLKKGKCVFLTGAAGCGKTWTTSRVAATWGCRGVALTASTAIAATRYPGGDTVHRWCGLGIRCGETAEERGDIAKQVSAHRWASARVRKASLLIVDEVSMLSAAFMDQLDAVLRRVRRVDKPFGGLPTLLVGDFLQLPPVGRGVAPAFASEVWKEAKPEVIELTHNHRLSHEPGEDRDAMEALLARVRVGLLTSSDRDFLTRRCMQRSMEEEESPMTLRLFSTRAEVDECNTTMHAAFAGEPADSRLGTWKVGSPVYITRNIDVRRGIVNGRRGILRDVLPIGSDGEVTAKVLIRVREGVTATVKVPVSALVLGFATTFHKAQGCTLPACVASTRTCFEAGHFYVVISRVPTLDRLTLLDLPATLAPVSDVVIDFLRRTGIAAKSIAELDRLASSVRPPVTRAPRESVATLSIVMAAAAK